MKRVFRAGSAAFSLAGALAALAISATPDDAFAQRTSRSAGARATPAKAAPSGGLDRERGMKEAPAAVQAARLTCTVTDAAFVGVAQGGANVYEAACREGLGFMVTAATATTPAQVVDCINQTATAARTPGVQGCRLSGNANPVQGLQPLLTAAGVTCTINNARYLGDTTTTNMARYEVGCANGPGYVLDRPKAAGVRPTATDCFTASAGGQFQCQYTTRQQSLARFTPLVAQSRRECVVSDARDLGVNTQTQNRLFEIGCQGRPGFLIETAANGSVASTYDCGRFGNVACQFTAATAAQALNASDYSRLLRAANFDCAVSDFKRIGAEQGTNRDIVEVACSNRPDGAFALLAADPGGRSEVYDCLLAPKRQQRCSLTQEEALYPRLNTALAGQRTKCNVTMTRRMGTTPQGEDWFEFACAEGRNYVVDYRGNGVIRQVLTCDKGELVLGGCKLPRAAASSARR